MKARLLRRVAITAVALTLIGASGAASARADNVITDGDGLTPVVASSLSIGNVACGATTTKTVALAVSRNGNGSNNPNIFANSAVVTVSVTGTSGAGLSAAAPADKITLPSGWVGSDNNTLSPVVYSSVTLTSKTAGVGSGTVTYSASGRNQDGVSTTTITNTINVSWTTGTCVTTTPTTTTVTCPTVHQTYTGSAITPCTAAVTGTNGFNQVLPVSYTPNTNAGSVTATASFAGDTTHLASSGSSGFVIDKAPSTTTVTCPPSVTYDSTAQTPCTASYTGVALPSATSVTPTYSNNTNAGTATASAGWSGDANHTASQDSKDFTITKAPSTTTISCNASGLAYTGAHLDPCTAEVTSVGLSKQSVGVKYDPNDIDAGPVTATATYAGDANHEASNTATATFTIGQASTVTSLTCDPAAQTFDGTHHAICSASVTGPNGLNKTVTVDYDDNLNAGTVHVTATFDGSSGNYASSSASATFVIAKAQPAVTVECTPAQVTYDGTAQKPCSASVSAPGMASQGLDVTYGHNVDAGTATASATFYETPNYLKATGSATFEIARAASTLQLSCSKAVYDGTAQEPCTGTVSGDGVIDPAVDIGYTYSHNTDAGSAAVSATWPGDGNHTASSASAVFSIDKAASSVSVTCPTSVTFTGKEQTPCSASVEGPGVKVVDDTHPILWAYLNNLHAGPASVSAIWDGDANHYGSHSDAVAFTIDKAASTVKVTCTPATVTFTGSELTPCTAAVTGVGGLDQALTVSYDKNLNAGTASASASYSGDVDHTASSGSTSFTIDKATSGVTVTCNPSSVTFTGSPIEPCTARATGVGGLDVDASVTYTNNVAVGTATATGTYAGDDNHTGSTGEATFGITKATSSVTVSCPTSMTYTGSAIQPCTATATGVGGLDQSVGVDYTDNVNAGTAKASAAFGGDDNHLAGAGSATFAIDKAPAKVTVTCSPSSVTFTGSAIQPCTAKVTGAGGLDEAVTVTYTDNVYVGSATASATYAGDANHLGDTGSAIFAIGKAPSTVTVTCPTTVTFTGSAIEPCTARATGVGGLDAAASVSYADNVVVGTATATGTYTGDANHVGSIGKATFAIGSWTPSGFYQPVDMGTTLNTVKNGSTVPLKFEVFRDGVELTSTSIVTSFTATTIACDTSAGTDAIEFTTTGGTSLRYDTTAGQFVQNWQTPKKPGTCYLVTMTTQDKSTVKAKFQLK